MADTAEAQRRARLERLLQAARELANPEKSAGKALRTRLLDTTGLSSAGIERGIFHSLETAPSEAELQALIASTPEAPRAHVLLSSNVFVGALRAAGRPPPARAQRARPPRARTPRTQTTRTQTPRTPPPRAQTPPARTAQARAGSLCWPT